jgi:hypothetical protein
LMTAGSLEAKNDTGCRRGRSLDHISVWRAAASRRIRATASASICSGSGRGWRANTGPRAPSRGDRPAARPCGSRPWPPSCGRDRADPLVPVGLSSEGELTRCARAGRRGAHRGSGRSAAPRSGVAARRPPAGAWRRCAVARSRFADCMPRCLAAGDPLPLPRRAAGAQSGPGRRTPTAARHVRLG